VQLHVILKRKKVECEEESVMVSPGSKELMFLLQAVYPAKLILPRPSWVSYEPQAKLLGRDSKWIDTTERNKWNLSAESLEIECKSDLNTKNRLLVLNYPNNPTGLSYNQKELTDIATVCRKYNILVLSDEIYSDFTFGQFPHHSMARYYPEGTIVSSGMSKSFGAGGWRLGYVVVPPNLRPLLNSMSVVATSTFSAVSSPIQHAAYYAYHTFHFPETQIYMEDCRRILRTLGNHISGLLREAGVTVHSPDGGFYIFPNFSAFAPELLKRNIRTSVEFTNALLRDTGVCLLAGADFGMPLSSLTTRLAFVDFPGERALDIIARRDRGHKTKTEIAVSELPNLTPKVLTAIDKIIKWLPKIK